jgi:GntR family transcriptional regulator
MITSSVTGPVAPAQAVNRENPTPYYAQLAAILRTTIEQSRRPHDPLPSEAELERAYGVSRTVVRQALSHLTNEGLIYRRKGKGSFVAERKHTAALFQTLVSFYDEMAARGHPPVSKVLTLKRITAPDDIAAALRVSENAPVIKLDRLRFVDGEPVVLSTSYIPYDLAPELLGEDLSRCSLYRVMEQKFGLQIDSGVRRIEAITARPADARMLGCKVGAPLLVVNSLVYLPSGRAVELSVSKHRADRTTFETRLVRTPAGAALLPRATAASRDGTEKALMSESRDAGRDGGD